MLLEQACAKYEKEMGEAPDELTKIHLEKSVRQLAMEKFGKHLEKIEEASDEEDE
jgi:hypothetical protein